MTALYYFVLIISSIIYTYCIYRFCCSFSHIFSVDRKIVWIPYSAFFLMTTVLQIFSISLLLKCLLLLALCYFVTWAHIMRVIQRIQATICAFLATVLTEIFLILLSLKAELHLFAMPSFNAMTGKILSLSLIWIVLFLCRLGIDHFEKKEIIYLDLPAQFCLPTTIILLSCISFIFDVNNHHRIFSFGDSPMLNDINRPDLFFYFICIALLILDVLIIYICERAKRLKELESEQNVLESQKAYYEKQLSIMKSSESEILSVQHDIKNHLAALHSIAGRDNAPLKDYLQEILEIETRQKVSKTGHALIDGLINYKAAVMANDNIKLDYHAAIPHELPFSHQDITVILGNLIDNAIDAAKKVPPEKQPYISIDLSFRRNSFILAIKNPYVEKISMTSASLSTTKKDSRFHGFGLKNVKKAIEKNDGILDIKYTDNVFSVCVILNG